MTTTATIKWVETTKPFRVLVIARVPQQVHVGVDCDVNGKYARYDVVHRDRDQPCYVWTDTVAGALLASLCDQACTRKLPVELTYDVTVWGWRLTDVSIEAAAA